MHGEANNYMITLSKRGKRPAQTRLSLDSMRRCDQVLIEKNYQTSKREVEKLKRKIKKSNSEVRGGEREDV